MSTKPETKLVFAISRALRQWGVYVRKIHGGPMQHAGLPDLYCAHRGHSFWLEVKIPGEEPTKRQALEHKVMREAGIKVGVVTSVEEALAFLPTPLRGK